MKNAIEISVVVVNYNVKDFLEQALHSVDRALQGLASEIFVVDNASADGSVQMVRRRFPHVRIIENNHNVGFSSANNQALRHARGKYVVLLNPDTIIQEDTFTKLLQFFNEHPDAAAATPKILNPDGTFSVDCRHSIPTPLTAFWKLIGFSKIFPKSRIFGRYNMTFLDEEELNQVEAISGSFMMIRRSVVDKVGLLDEDFFMYCEDIDYCHRINQQGGKIYYVPESQIIHYKGESTKKNNLDYVITFNRSLYQFYKKHYQQKYIYPFKWLILLGTILRGVMIFIRNNFMLYYPLLFDIILLNVVMFVLFFIRYEIRGNFVVGQFFQEYIIINIITTIAYFLASLSFESINRDRYSISKIIKANGLTYLFVAALTFFFKQFAYSRGVVLAAAILNTILMVSWRVLLRIYGKRSATALGRDYWLKPTLIVGYDRETRVLLKKLQGHVDTALKFVGVAAMQEDQIGSTLEGLPVVTSVDKLPDYLRMNRISLVLFTTHNISYEAILTTMARVQNPRVEFKMVPGHLEFMIGKSNIERLDNVPLVDIEYAYGKIYNRFIKRSADIASAMVALLLLFPLNLLLIPYWIKNVRLRSLYLGEKRIARILDADKPGLLKWTVRMIEVLRGPLSLVGAPIQFEANSNQYFEYKPGLTGLVQINRHRIPDAQSRRNYDVHYLKNQNFFYDVEILLRAIFK